MMHQVGLYGSSVRFPNWVRPASPIEAGVAYFCKRQFDKAAGIVLASLQEAPSFENAYPVLASKVADSKAEGAKLIVVDPRRIGLAVKADCWLRVRSGTDAAIASAIAGLMLDRVGF